MAAGAGKGEGFSRRRIEHRFTGPLADAIKKYGKDAARAVLVKNMRPYLRLSVELVARTVAEKAPKNFSILANSFLANIVVKELTASDGTPLLYGLVQEEGRRAKHPGRDGVAALTLWAKRRFGVGDKEARNIAWRVAHVMATRDMPGKHYFRDAIREKEAQVRRFLEAGADKALRELGGKPG